MYSSTKRQPAIRRWLGTPGFKRCPHDCQCHAALANPSWSNNKPYSTPRRCCNVCQHSPHQTGAAAKEITKRRGAYRSTRRDLGQGVLLEPPCKEVQGISLIHSDRGIYLGDVIASIVNHPRTSLGLMTHHQPVTACGSSLWHQGDGHADHPAS